MYKTLSLPRFLALLVTPLVFQCGCKRGAQVAQVPPVKVKINVVMVLGPNDTVVGDGGGNAGENNKGCRLSKAQIAEHIAGLNALGAKSLAENPTTNEPQPVEFVNTQGDAWTVGDIKVSNHEVCLVDGGGPAECDNYGFPDDPRAFTPFHWIPVVGRDFDETPNGGGSWVTDLNVVNIYFVGRMVGDRGFTLDEIGACNPANQTLCQHAAYFRMIIIADNGPVTQGAGQVNAKYRTLGHEMVHYLVSHAFEDPQNYAGEHRIPDQNNPDWIKDLMIDGLNVPPAMGRGTCLSPAAKQELYGRLLTGNIDVECAPNTICHNQ